MVHFHLCHEHHDYDDHHHGYDHGHEYIMKDQDRYWMIINNGIITHILSRFLVGF